MHIACDTVRIGVSIGSPPRWPTLKPRAADFSRERSTANPSPEFDSRKL
jgi:hypothetical protein